MEIHKPKSWHNWREFLKEVGTIVLGVSIALAAEQAVEWWHWRGEVAQARIAIANELAISLVASIDRVRTENCTEKRLDDLAAIVDAASRNGMLPPVPEFSRPPTSVWPSESWQSIMASQTATHFSDKELDMLGVTYAQIQRQGTRAPEEGTTWSQLYTLVGPGRRLDPASESMLRVALSQARYENRINAVVSGQIVPRIMKLNLPFSADSRTRIDKALHKPIADIYTCQPVEKAIPPGYGQGPGKNYFYTVRDWLKYPPYAPKTKGR